MFTLSELKKLLNTQAVKSGGYISLLSNGTLVQEHNSLLAPLVTNPETITFVPHKIMERLWENPSNQFAEESCYRFFLKAYYEFLKYGVRNPSIEETPKETTRYLEAMIELIQKSKES